MREIKFRAWHKNRKKMFSAEIMASDQLTLLPTGKFINVNGDSTKLSVVLDSMIPLQFTGLKDVEGKEVYEGDIVNFTYWWFDGNIAESTLTGTIVYSDHSMSFQLKGVKNKEWQQHTGYENDAEYLTPFSELNFDGSDFEVIGNIYETPELLMGKQQ